MLILNYRQLIFVNWCSIFRIVSDQNQAFLTTGYLTESKSVQVVILKWSGKNRVKLPKGECVISWYGLFYGVVIGRYFFNQPTIKQENCLNTIFQFALPRPTVMFMLDGARPHSGFGVRRFLERRVSWSVDRTRPPRSTNVVHLYVFFLVKAEVCIGPINNLK